ncbi:MAG: DUF1190 domain-containing protein [Thioalkalivibrionaceae bacterium]
MSLESSRIGVSSSVLDEQSKDDVDRVGPELDKNSADMDEPGKTRGGAVARPTCTVARVGTMSHVRTSGVMLKRPWQKRSRRAALILMAPLAGGVVFALGGCSGEGTVDAVSFHDIPECSRFGADPDECQQAWNAAKEQHTRGAPRYVDRNECEADFGAEACEPAPERHAGGSYFMPMMAGFLMGQMMGQRGAGAAGLAPGGVDATRGGTASQAVGSGPRAGAQSLSPQPLYKSRDDRANFRTATNRVVGPAGPVQVRPSVVAPQGAQLVRRGGFGQQAATRMTPTRGVGG